MFSSWHTRKKEKAKEKKPNPTPTTIFESSNSVYASTDTTFLIRSR